MAVGWVAAREVARAAGAWTTAGAGAVEILETVPGRAEDQGWQEAMVVD